MWKLDLKRAYFNAPLHSSSRKYVRFLWSGNIYKFLCLCFSLGLATLLLTKIIKIPISHLGKLDVRIIKYLVDMLLLVRTMAEIQNALGSLVF